MAHRSKRPQAVHNLSWDDAGVKHPTHLGIVVNGIEISFRDYITIGDIKTMMSGLNVEYSIVLDSCEDFYSYQRDWDDYLSYVWLATKGYSWGYFSDMHECLWGNPSDKKKHAYVAQFLQGKLELPEHTYKQYGVEEDDLELQMGAIYQSINK